MLLDLAERGWLPDLLVRAGIRRMLRERLAEEAERAGADPGARRGSIRRLARPRADRARPRAGERSALRSAAGVLPGGARPAPEVQLRLFLGPDARRLPRPRTTLLEQVCAPSRLADGQRVLELGCGWGSLTLWMAERFPRSRIIAVSNSQPQREHIQAEARGAACATSRSSPRRQRRSQPEARFDRVVSVEMFEHLRNWPRLSRASRAG